MSHKILPMKDALSNYKVIKETMFDLPFKLIIVGKSELSGKSTMIGNLLLRPFDDEDYDGCEFYKHDFEGDNIYVVCPSIMLDTKWASIIKGKKIPEANVMMEYDETELEMLYKRLEQQYQEELEDGDVKQKLIIFDDCSFSGALKDKIFGILARIVCNGRHSAISSIFTTQKYSSLSTTIRENATGCIFFECSHKQMELVAEDHSSIPKKEFERMFRDATKEKHSFMIVNYSNPPDKRFLNSKFEPMKC